MKHAILVACAAIVLNGCQDRAANASADDALTDAADVAAPSSEAEAGPPPMPTAPSKNPDMTELATKVDANNDGKMSRAEWEAKGLPESSFNMFEKARGYVTLDDYRNNAAPSGIDLNGDGKVTVIEFKEFDRKMSADRPAGPGPRG